MCSWQGKGFKVGGGRRGGGQDVTAEKGPAGGGGKRGRTTMLRSVQIAGEEGAGWRGGSTAQGRGRAHPAGKCSQ